MLTYKYKYFKRSFMNMEIPNPEGNDNQPAFIAKLKSIVEIPQEVINNKDELALAEILQEAISSGNEEKRAAIADIDLPGSVESRLNWNGSELHPQAEPSQEEGSEISADELKELGAFVQEDFSSAQEAREHFKNKKYDDESLANMPPGYDKL